VEIQVLTNPTFEFLCSDFGVGIDENIVAGMTLTSVKYSEVCHRDDANMDITATLTLDGKDYVESPQWCVLSRLFNEMGRVCSSDERAQLDKSRYR